MFGRLLLFLILTFTSSVYALEYKVINGKVTEFKVVTVIQVFNIESPTSRIEFTDTNGESLKIVVNYSGRADDIIPLANGTIVEQFGIKLRSVDTCNVVYIMRIVNTVPRISISYKRNDGMSEHTQCRDKGYTVVKNIPLPELLPGTTTVLEARYNGNILTVKENNKIVWAGEVNFSKRGVAGFRSDNIKVNFSIN